MAEKNQSQKIIVVGAGPVGALAALYAAQRGHEVELYELRSDLRDPSTTPLNFTKSINLALSERGINALRHCGRPSLLEKIFAETIPLAGRMIHGGQNGRLTEQSQAYDVYGRTNYAADRGGLNKLLLDELEAMPNIKFFFNHKLTGADFKNNKAWFTRGKSTPGKRDEEIEVGFDLLIGADGAHSAVRYHLMKYTRMDYQQEYIDTLWCEFHIDAKEVSPGEAPESRFRIDPNHLHIWPGKNFMFIAIASFDGSFTCTLFMPSSDFASLSQSDPTALIHFFNMHFPGVTTLIPKQELIDSFTSNPHLPLISIKCSPFHYSSSCVILGDAAHAMVPFYGQGMNAGFEDVFVLFQFLDRYAPGTPHITPRSPAKHREYALEQYSKQRVEDAHAINDLALQNYKEMRADVTSPLYLARKWLEEKISISIPSLGWKTKYSRVSFGNERYSEVIRQSERQGKMLVGALLGFFVGPVIIGGLVYWARWRRAVGNGLGLGAWWEKMFS